MNILNVRNLIKNYNSIKFMSLEKGYVKIILYILFFAISISALKTYKSYDLYHDKKRINYNSAANLLSGHLDDTFSYVDKIINVLAREILKLKNITPGGVASVLFQYKNIIINNNNLLPWTVFDFVDKDGFVLATSRDGTLNNPKRVSKNERQWISLAHVEPWKGHLSYLDHGIISGEYILPYGYGIASRNGDFIGTISMGLNVVKLRSKLVEALGNVQIKFLIFRKDRIKNNVELIFNNIGDQILVPDKIKDIISSKNSTGKVDFKLNNVAFKHLHNELDSNFIIVIGQDASLLTNEFISYISPRIEQSIVLLLLLVIIYVIIKRKVVNPILNLSKLSKEIADGSTNIIIPRYDCAEIDYLAQQIKKIKRYIGIEEKKEKAEWQNIYKSSFLSSVSHEIRNPITAIYSIGEILENKEGYDALDDENKRYFLREIKNQASESLEFIQDLLDVGQSESGNFKLAELKEENLEELMYKSIKIVRGSAIRSEITIDFKSDICLPKILCDQRRIKQIFVNLLNNSIKYSNKNTKISIKIKESSSANKKIKIILRDQGFGMSKSGIKKALIKYGTIKNNNTHKVDSLGLGLPLVRHLIEEHKGSLKIESEIGKGSKFTIEF